MPLAIRVLGIRHVDDIGSCIPERIACIVVELKIQHTMTLVASIIYWFRQVYS